MVESWGEFSVGIFEGFGEQEEEEHHEQNEQDGGEPVVWSELF